MQTMSTESDAEKIRRATDAYEEQQRQLGQRAAEAAAARAEQNRQYGEQLDLARDAAMARLEALNFRWPGVEMVDISESQETGRFIKKKETIHTKVPGWKIRDGGFSSDPSVQGTYSMYFYLLADGSLYGHVIRIDGEH